MLDHVWQSTLFVLVIGLLSLLLRKNGAHVRYWLWLAASVKFLVPFSLLVLAGAQFGSLGAEDPRMGQLGRWVGMTLAPASAQAGPVTIAAEPESAIAELQPASGELAGPASQHTQERSLLAVIAGLVWLAGACLVLTLWLARWLRLRRLVHEAVVLRSPLPVDMPMPVLESPSSVEPGIAGIFRPVLLLPRGIADRLPAAQLRAILTHELAHWRRRDNFTASLHMLVEVLFWFHPLVWWIGGRLIREREHACDEAVLRLGESPHEYAEGILNVCQYYVAPPLRSAAISGGDLRLRIQNITTNPTPEALDMKSKGLLTGLALAIVAVPMLIGTMGTARAAATTVRDPQNAALETLYQAALREGEVTVVIMDARDGNWMSAAFAEAFPGIRIRILPVLGHLPLILSDAQSPRPALDVILTSLIEAQALDDAGYLASTDWRPFKVAASRVSLDGRFAHTNNIVYTLAYDERRVDGQTVPVAWRELLEPRYRGIMSTNAFVMPRVLAGLGISWGQAGAHSYARELVDRQEVLVQFGDAALYFLDQNSPRRFYLGMASTITEQWESQNLPSGYVVPEPVIMEQQGTAVLATAPHPAAARLLAGWLASEQARALRHREAQASDLLPDSNDPLAVALRGRNVAIVYDTPEAVRARTRLAEGFQSLFAPDAYNPYQPLPRLRGPFVLEVPELPLR